MKWIIPNILHFITGNPRYFPEFDLSSNPLWTYKVYRIFGSVFGERYGIRKAMSFRVEDGITKRKFYTLEARLAHYEARLRAFFLWDRRYFDQVWNPRAFQYGAIAFGATSSGTAAAASASTGTITVSGSNTFGASAVWNNNANSPTCTWNGSSMTAPQAAQSNGGTSTDNAFYIVAPTTGVVTGSATSATAVDVAGVYYTGVNQTGQPDSSNVGNTGGNNSTSLTWSTTVVASNCWLVMGGRENSGAGSPGTGTTTRQHVLGNGTLLLDSNGTVGTGSQSLIWQGDAANSWLSGVIMSFAPVAAATTTLPFKALLGVGI